jgi:nucleotide sugar dehydrogenase
MARFCHELDIDLWDVIRAAATKPFGFQAFYPGPGVGGHCIPIDPNYLSHQIKVKLGYPFRFVELAQEINNSMPTYVVRRVQDALNTDGKAVRGSRVLLLGVTYKPNIADQRESPTKPLANQLIALGADVAYHDPYVQTWNLGATTLDTVTDLAAELASCDIAVLLQNHSSYDLDLIAEKAPHVLDTRGVISDPAVDRL